MWRRESIGTGSVACGEDGVGLSSNNDNRHPHRHPFPRRFDSTDLADTSVRNEALKLVREVNRAVAGHVALATLVGGSGDGPHLRDELRKKRRTAQEAAADATRLLPSLIDQQKSEKERNELERLWYLLLCCLDALEMSMHRSLTIFQEFSMGDGSNNVVIHTGIDCPNHTVSTRLSDKSLQGNSSELQYREKINLEGVEASQLCKELFELRAQLTELKATVELRSISMPDFDEMSDPSNNKGPRRTDTLISINFTDGLGGNSGLESASCSIPSDDKESLASDTSQTTGITNAQRRCVCWILGIMVAMFFLAMILGVFIALFS